MSLDTMKDYVHGVTDAVLTPARWFVVTQAQYDLLYADATDARTPPTPPPWGKRIARTTPRFMGKPVTIAEVGVDISALVGPVIDLRGI